MDDENVKGKIYNASDVLPVMEHEAQNKGLKVFVFKDEELKEFFNTKYDGMGVALLAKSENNALYNLRNLRRCILIWPEL